MFGQNSNSATQAHHQTPALAGNQHLQTLRLYIPEECKADILALVNQLVLQNIRHEHTRDTIKRVFYQTAVSIRLAYPLDTVNEWERCTKLAEADYPVSIFDFWKTLATAAEKNFKLHTNGGWGGPAHQRLLSITIYTALTKGLFTQFASENNLYQCTQRLHDAVRNTSLVNWQKIDTSGFVSRLRQKWSAFYPLMFNEFFYRSDTSLLSSIGMNISDFTYAFFSSNELRSQVMAPCNLHSDLLGLIAGFLNDAQLQTFRQISRAYYNAVEKNNTLRIRHRLHLVSTNVMLQELIGKVLYYGNDYLLTDPVRKPNHYNYRVTSMKSPYQSVSYFGKQGPWDKIIGGYVNKDDAGNLTILTAFRSNVHDSHFTVQKLKVNALKELTELQQLTELQNFKTIKVVHDAKSVTNNYRAPIWERKATINVKEGKGTIDVKFTECIGEGYCNHRLFRSVVERYQAAFNMSDFESDVEQTVEARKIDPQI